MDSLGTNVKSHLTPYDTVPELYRQLVTQYGVTGIARELEIYAAYVRQPLGATKADFARFQTAVTSKNSDFARLMKSFNNDLSVLDKLVFFDNLPAPFQSKVVRVLAKQFSSAAKLPALAELATHVRAEMDPTTILGYRKARAATAIKSVISIGFAQLENGQPLSFGLLQSLKTWHTGGLRT
ncbi:hypothetical protein OIV83_003431 [Microbotryomycetes sp. JL201]|nr:hypothetical protein OIV83_003431 [Microbotryomycetes sp. JL201]